MSSAEALAAEFEQDGGPEFHGNGKRSKNERADHKHGAQPGGDTRKIVENAVNGEAKRKEK